MEALRKRKRLAIAEVLLCAALWSIAGVFIKLIPWNSMVIAGARSLLSGAVVSIYMKASHLRLVPNRRSLWGAVSLWLTMTLFVTANKLTTAANAIVLQFTAPMFIVVFSSLVLKKRFTHGDVTAVLLTMAGISLFFFDRLDSGRLLGNIVAVGSGVSFAFYYMSLGSSGKEERLSAILMANIMTVLVSLPFIALTKPEVSLMPCLYIIILGVFQLGIPYVLLGVASEYCPPLACSLLGALEPLLNPVWVFFATGEAPGVYALCGGALVVLTISLWCVYSDRAERKKAVEQN